MLYLAPLLARSNKRSNEAAENEFPTAAFHPSQIPNDDVYVKMGHDCSTVSSLYCISLL